MFPNPPGLPNQVGGAADESLPPEVKKKKKEKEKK